MHLKRNSLLDIQKYDSFSSQLKIPSIQQSIFLEECKRKIYIIRDDLIHPIISGNKWRKLKYHLKYFSENGFRGIVSMGGAFSNHLHALTFVCNQLEIPCSILVYGLNGKSNSPTLKDCKNWNAQLLPITRQQAAIYRYDGMKSADERHQHFYWIPEGGGGLLGAYGMKELIEVLDQDFDQKDNLIVCASGTGTSIQGILDNTQYCQIATKQIVRMAEYPWIKHERIRMIYSDDHHSFANRVHRVMEFINDFKNRYDILLDPIYTGPLMFSFLQSEEWHKYDKIYFIHTGGLQANRIK